MARTGTPRKVREGSPSTADSTSKNVLSTRGRVAASKSVKTRSCRSCGKTFKRKAERKRHENGVHNVNARRYACDYAHQGCTFTSTQPTNVRVHIDSVHLDVKHECVICPKNLSSQSAVIRHRNAKHGVTADQWKKREEDYLSGKVPPVFEEMPMQEEPQHDVPQFPIETPSFQELEHGFQFVSIPQPILEESFPIPAPTPEQSLAPPPDFQPFVPPPDVDTIANLETFMHTIDFNAIADVRALIPVWLVHYSNATLFTEPIFWTFFSVYFRQMFIGNVYWKLVGGGGFESENIQRLVMGVFREAELATEAVVGASTAYPAQADYQAGFPQTTQGYYSPYMSPMPSPTWSVSSAASSSVESLLLNTPVDNSFHNAKQDFFSGSSFDGSTVAPTWLETTPSPLVMAEFNRVMQGGIGVAY